MESGNFLLVFGGAILAGAIIVAAWWLPYEPLTIRLLSIMLAGAVILGMGIGSRIYYDVDKRMDEIGFKRSFRS